MSISQYFLIGYQKSYYNKIFVLSNYDSCLFLKSKLVKSSFTNCEFTESYIKSCNISNCTIDDSVVLNSVIMSQNKIYVNVCFKNCEFKISNTIFINCSFKNCDIISDISFLIKSKLSQTLFCQKQLQFEECTIYD